MGPPKKDSSPKGSNNGSDLPGRVDMSDEERPVRRDSSSGLASGSTRILASQEYIKEEKHSHVTAQMEAKKAAERMVAYDMQREKYKAEEDMGRIQNELEGGYLNESEARRLVARAKLHDQEKENMRNAAMAGADFASTDVMLEHMLDNTSLVQNPVNRFLLQSLGLYQLHLKALRERERRKSPEFKHPHPKLRAFVHSLRFDLIIGLIMLGNGIMIGIQTSAKDENPFYDNLEQVFTFVFVLELVVRVAADGWTWVWDTANFCDLALIISTGVIPMWIFRPMAIDSTIVRAFSVLRILRLIRLVRMVRMFPVFKILWSLIQGVLDSVRTLLYTYVIITIVLYIFAIFAVYLIGKSEEFEGSELATYYFGDVPKAMFTFFQVITLDSWTDICRPLMKQSQIVAPLFVIVILVVTLALLNLVVAVICNNAFDRARQDEDLIATQKRAMMQTEIAELERMFVDMDTSRTGAVSREEFMTAVETSEEVQTKFNVLEVLPSEYNELWQLLDDGSGEVKTSRFADTLRALRGEAKSKDSFSILRRVQKANDRIQQLNELLHERRALAAELRAEATEVRQKLGLLQHDLCDIVVLMGTCVPSKPVVEATAERIEEEADKLHDQVEPWL